MNRYSEISPSVYNPMTMQELMMVPLMKRQQHNQLLAEQEAIRTNLAKVDPLDVHLNEAMQLKNGIESKMDNTALELSKTGISNDMIGKTIALNREYQNLVAPTGRIGKINTAKTQYLTEQKAYLDNAEKNGVPRDAAILNWTELAKNKYTGYGPNQEIKNIDSLGAPNKQDFEEDISKAHGILGSYEQGLAAKGYKVVNREDGSIVFADASGNLTTKTNIPQVDEALQSFNKKWFTPKGEGYEYAKHSRLDFNNLAERAVHSFNSMKETSRNDFRGIDYSYTKPDKEKKADETSPLGMTQSTTTVGTNLKDYDALDRIGMTANTNIVGSPTLMGTAGTNLPGKKFTYEDLPEDVKKRYIATYNALRADGRIHNTRNANDPKAVALVKKELQSQGPVTLSTKVMLPDRSPNEYMFSGELASKSITERTNSIASDLVAGRRKLQDPENPNKVLTPEEFNEKGYKVKYDSYLSPHNFAKNPFGEKGQGAVPHQVLVVDKDGNRIGTSLVSRTQEELDSPQGRASEVLHDVFTKTVVIPNQKVSFSNQKLKEKGIDKMSVKYITRDPNTKKPLSEPYYSVEVNNSPTQLYSEDEFINTVYNTIGK